MTDKRLIVGLGNPGPKYQNNRHNIGFQIMDLFAKHHGLTFSRQQENAFIATGVVLGASIVLAKPQTFMNKSGRSVGALQRFYKVALADLLVVYDELDLPAGTIRMRPQGGSGGQKGVRSVIQHVGDEGFPRMRIGIGRPPGKMPPAAYVLQDFKGDEVSLMDETRERAVNAIETWLQDGIELAMSRHNGPAPETL